MTKEQYEAGIKEKLAGRRGSAVDLPGSGATAYMREPSYEEYMLLQSQSDAPHDVYVPAFALYVKQCFMGACDKEGAELTFEDVRRMAGAAFVTSGPLGTAVNRLAGQVQAPTRSL